MNLQFQTVPTPLHNESKTGNHRGEKAPTHEYPNNVVVNSLHTETCSNQQAIKNAAAAKSSQAVYDAAISKLSGDFLKAQNLFEDIMSKPISKDDPTTVGTTLAAISGNIQNALETAQNATCNEIPQENPKIPFGGGFVIDLVCGTISFDISVLLNQGNSQKSSNDFIKSLESNKNNNSFPLFKDVMTESSKVPTELKLQKDIDRQNQTKISAFKKIKEQYTELSNAYTKIDSEKALGLLY